MLKKSLPGIAVFLCLTMGAGVSYAYAKTIEVQLWHSDPCTLGAYCTLTMQHGEKPPVIVCEGRVNEEKMKTTISYDAAYDGSIGARLSRTSEESVHLFAEIIFPWEMESHRTQPILLGKKGREECVVLDLSRRSLGMPVGIPPSRLGYI
jgi:hypothetical protein